MRKPGVSWGPSTNSSTPSWRLGLSQGDMVKVPETLNARRKARFFPDDFSTQSKATKTQRLLRGSTCRHQLIELDRRNAHPCPALGVR